jgi:hypothetical protein
VAFELEEMLSKLISEEYMKEMLVNLSEEEIEILKAKNLDKNFLDHELLNDFFINKLYENVGNREIYIAEIEEKIKQDEEEKIRIARRRLIEQQFSDWDGSHRNLTNLIKNSMNDPKSYKHLDTRFFDNGDHLIVQTEFRGSNAFGGIVRSTIRAKVSIEGQVIEIISQE